MSRKHKIIISITGIVVITLALIGVTYGYFLTRVTGNTNENSILLTTANLELKYDDNNSVIDASNIHPGEDPRTKTFKVSNTGNDIVEYGVYLESVINDFVGTEDLILKIECESSVQGNTCNGYGVDSKAYYPTINTLLLSNSIAAGEVHNYTLTLEYIDTGFDQSVDMGKTLSGKIQIYNPTDIVALTGTVTNAEDNYYVEVQSNPVTSQIKNGTYFISGVIPGEHTVFVKYLDNNNNPVTVAQKSIVISKGAEAGEVTEVNNIVTIPILATSESITLPITVETDETDTSKKVLKLTNIVVNEPTLDTLAQKIIDNAKVGSGTRTVYTANPITTPGQVLSTSTERTLSTTDDVYTATTGNKSYYFRGNVEDNYVAFANMCWRIVRIQGDGSIKLILADGLASCSSSTTSKTDSGYITYSNGVEITSTYENIVTTLNDWYSSKGLGFYQTEYLKNETWYDGDDGTKVSTTGDVSCNDPYYDGNEACTDEVWDYTVYEYVGGNRISNTEDGFRYYTTLPNLGASPKLNTPNEVMYTGYIGTLNADEVAFAGSAYYNKNSTYYLSDNVSGHYWWTLTMAQEHSTSNKYAYSVYDGEESACSYYKDIYDNEKCSMGIVTSNISSVQNAVRPVITLKDTVMYKTGDGTPGNAYQVK